MSAELGNFVGGSIKQPKVEAFTAWRNRQPEWKLLSADQQRLVMAAFFAGYKRGGEDAIKLDRASDVFYDG